MKNPTTDDSRLIIVGIVTIVCVTIFAVAAVLIFAREGTDIVPIVGMIPPTVAALAALGQVHRVAGKVDRVDRATEDLTNGLMDSKIRAGVADVIPDHLLDDAYTRQQLAADRMRVKNSRQAVEGSHSKRRR